MRFDSSPAINLLRSTRLLARGLITVAVIAVVAMAGAPASADAAYVQIKNKEMGLNPGWCLDSNMQGSVYINPCKPGNRFQMWERWDGGWTRNVATRKCLTVYSTQVPGFASFVYASDCIQPPVFTQRWRTWQGVGPTNPGGWYKPVDFNDSRVRCLKRKLGSVHSVELRECRNPTGYHHPRELWYVVNVP